VYFHPYADRQQSAASDDLLVIVVVLGFAAVAGLFVTLTVRNAGGRRKKLDDILLPIGFQRCEAEPAKARLSIDNMPPASGMASRLMRSLADHQAWQRG
jgi:hypothetical protein